MAGVVCGATSLVEPGPRLPGAHGPSLDPHAAFLGCAACPRWPAMEAPFHHGRRRRACWRVSRRLARLYPAWQPSAARVASRELARRGRHCSVRAGGRGVPRRAAVIDTLTIPVRTASARSVSHRQSPPSTTHRQLGDADLAAAGITPGCFAARSGSETSTPHRRLLGSLERRVAATVGGPLPRAPSRAAPPRPRGPASRHRPKRLRLTVRRTTRSPAPVTTWADTATRRGPTCSSGSADRPPSSLGRLPPSPDHRPVAAALSG